MALTEEQLWKEDLNAQQALAEAEDASTAMLKAAEVPRSFMFCCIALISTVLTLINVVPWLVILCLAALSIPLGWWYFLESRKRPKPRYLMTPSAAQAGYMILAIIAMQGSQYWVPDSWVVVVAKGVVIFGIWWFCLSRLRGVVLKDRLKEAYERPI